MKNIFDYLIIDTQRYSKGLVYSDYKFELEINQIQEKDNPFYIPFGDNIKHWELKIVPYYKDEDEPEMDWTPTLKDNELLRFKMCSHMKPTIELFSEHIRTECLAVINALGINLSECYIWDLQQALYINRGEIEPKHVYAFLKNIHKDYTKTESFLSVIDFYTNRMWHCVKFMNLLIDGVGAAYSMDWDYPIGEHFLAFLTDDAKFVDYYETKKS
jgi:hypothetical protein